MNKFIKFISRRSTWSIPYVVFLLLFVVLPLILIGVYAFMDYSGNFTVANFVKFIEQPEAIKTFVYSVAIAIITTFLCILLGYPAAYILSNKELTAPRRWCCSSSCPCGSTSSSVRWPPCRSSTSPVYRSARVPCSSASPTTSCPS